MKRTQRGQLIGLLAAAALLTGGLTAAGAAPDEDAPVVQTTVMEMSGAPAPVIIGEPEKPPLRLVARLTVLKPDGTPLAGVSFARSAWPQPAAMEALGEGETVAMHELGTSTTLSDGSLSIFSPRHDSLPAEYVGPGGQVDLTVSADVDGQVYTYSMSVYTDRQLEQVNGDGDGSADEMDVSTFTALPADTTEGATSAAPGSAPEATTSDKACTVRVWRDYGRVFVPLGTSASAVSGVTAQATYRVGTDTTIETAASVSGKIGTFSISGSRKLDAGTTSTWAKISGIHQTLYRTYYVFKLYQTFCSYTGTVRYEIRAAQYWGGTYTTPTTVPTTNYCARYTGGYEQYRGAGRKFSVATSTFVGLNLGSATNWSTQFTMKYEFTSARNVCGTNVPPGSNPAQIRIRAA